MSFSLFSFDKTQVLEPIVDCPEPSVKRRNRNVKTNYRVVTFQNGKADGTVDDVNPIADPKWRYHFRSSLPNSLKNKDEQGTDVQQSSSDDQNQPDMEETTSEERNSIDDIKFLITKLKHLNLKMFTTSEESSENEECNVDATSYEFSEELTSGSSCIDDIPVNVLLDVIKRYREKHSLMKHKLNQTINDSRTDEKTLNNELTVLKRRNILLNRLLNKNRNQEIKRGEISFDEEQEIYQKKLIQLTEMYGEIMEHNDRLQMNVVGKDLIIKRIYIELESMRGSRGPHVDRMILNFSAIITIPEVCLANVPNLHYVYRINIETEKKKWNVFKRYSELRKFHLEQSKKYPIISIFEFPPKKYFGNREPKLVEERRLILQNYLQKVVNHTIAHTFHLCSNTTKKDIGTLIPFLRDAYEPIDWQ